MSISSVVDERYRLQADDLAGERVTATVSNVSVQGLEQLQPVLHFQDLRKRFVLDDAQSDAMARITGQAVLEGWIGVRISLSTAVDEAGEPTIVIEAAGADAVNTTTLPETHGKAPALAWRQPLLLILLLVLAAGMVYLVENGASLLDALQQFFTPAG